MVKHIFIGGKKRPIRFSFGALKKLRSMAKEFGIDDSGESEALELIEIQIYVGLEFGAKKQKQQFEETFEDVQDWLDDMDVAEVMKISTTISEMLTGHLPDATDQEGKN